jgi:hypothetical protein
MSQQKGEKKRARAPNFSPGEKVALLNLIKTYSHIIENKKTDAVTWQDKSKAWGELDVAIMEAQLELLLEKTKNK